MAREMERVALTNAFVRTTTAITVFHGGIKVINFFHMTGQFLICIVNDFVLFLLMLKKEKAKSIYSQHIS